VNICFEEMRKSMKKLSSKAGVTTEIRTRNFQNESLYISLLCQEHLKIDSTCRLYCLLFFIYRR